MQRVSGTNMTHVKMNNRAQILNQLKDGRKSRKDIAERINLTPAAVTILVNELMQEGSIIESNQIDVSGSVGRKKIFIELNRNYKYTIGIRIESDLVSVGIADLSSDILQTESMKVSSKIPLDEISRDIVKTCMDMLWNLNISKEDVLGVGLNVENTNYNKGDIEYNSYSRHKDTRSVEELLSERLQLPVITETTVNSLALAEMEFRKQSTPQNLIFIKYGIDISSAIILNSEIYKGSFGNAGSIEHVMVGIKELQDTESKNKFLAELSVGNIIEETAEEYNAVLYPILARLTDNNPENIDEERLIQSYLYGEQQIIKKINKKLEFLAVFIINIIHLLDPDKIILYGSFAMEEAFFNQLLSQIMQIDPDRDILKRIEKSVLDQEKCIGSAVLANNELFFKTGGII